MAAPTPWRPQEAATPLRWCDEAELAGLAARLAEVLSGWQQAWGWQGPPASPRCAPADAAFLQGPWQCWRVEAQPAVWLCMEDASQDALLRGLFGAPVPEASSWAGLARGCVQDAAARIAAAFGAQSGGSDAAAPARALGRSWSGAVAATLCDRMGWKLLLAPAAMARCKPQQRGSSPRGPARQPPLTVATEALAGQRIRIEARLAGCELPLGALQQLRPGDVVRLPHRLEQPARVAHGAGHALFSGYMGRRGNARALELADAAEAGAT